MTATGHTAVMADEVLHWMKVRPDGHYLDATFGGGGHSSRLLSLLSDAGRLTVMDRDPEALERASHAPDLARALNSGQLRPLCDRFSRMGRHLSSQSLDGILMDLGISSIQLDDDSRGFSFHATGPLDMRMDRRCGRTAAEWLAQVEVPRMLEVFREYGKERYAAAIAEEIDRVRRLSVLPESADELAALVCRIKPARDGRRHPATRVFQALRMVVNTELEELDAGLAAAVRLLRNGGRLIVISFHSLEDSRVAGFIAGCAEMTPLTRAIGPGPDEKRRNARARSALLRVAEKAPMEAAA